MIKSAFLGRKPDFCPRCLGPNPVSRLEGLPGRDFGEEKKNYAQKFFERLPEAPPGIAEATSEGGCATVSQLGPVLASPLPCALVTATTLGSLVGYLPALSSCRDSDSEFLVGPPGHLSAVIGHLCSLV